jgi:peroxiredoxin
MTTRRLLLTCTIITALMLAGTGCKKKGEPTVTSGSADTSAAMAAQQASLTMAPDFALMDSMGKKVSLTDYEGSIVVLEWTNYECPFVAKYYDPANMVILETAQKYSDKNVVWLAINSTNTATAAGNEEWRQKNKIPYPVLDDHLGVVGRLYCASNTPQVVVMDKERRIIYYGAVDNDAKREKQPADRINYVDKALTEFLSGKPVTTKRTQPEGCTVKYAPASAATEMK